MASLLNKVLSVKGRKRTGYAGVAIGADRFALALVRRDGNDKPSLQHCAVHQVPAAGLPAALKSTLEKLGASRATACAVLDGEDYQVVKVEAPDVLPAEMRAAIRWRLRDVISFELEDAAVDTFEIPDPVRSAQTRMLFVVAARGTAITRVTSALAPAAPGFNAIDIPELCLRNLSSSLPQDAKGVAMLALNADHVQLLITRQGVMYLTRRIDIGHRFDPHRQRGGGNEPDAAALALELQRSLDYYETHYDQTPIGDLVIAPGDERARRLAEALKSETSVRVSVLNTRELLNVAGDEEPVTDWSTLIALGAALRVDTEES